MATRTIRRTSRAAPRSGRAVPAEPAPTTHPLVDQLRFTRSEWLRGLQGLSEEDGARHFGQMNSVGWIVGHLTWQEQRYHLDRPRSIVLYPAIKERFAFGPPMSKPSP